MWTGAVPIPRRSRGEASVEGVVTQIKLSKEASDFRIGLPVYPRVVESGFPRNWTAALLGALVVLDHDLLRRSCL